MNKKLPPFSDNRKSKTCTELSRSIQNRKLVGIVALVVTFAMCGVVAQAQQAGKVPRIGILELGSPSASASQIKAFQQGLHDLGYIEGKNIILEYRYAHGKLDLLPELAAELVRLQVDAIVTRSTAPIRAAKNASKTIPIVFATAGAPIEDGLVASLARPGGNVTGLALLSAEMDGKKLELLKEAFPKVTRVAFLWTVGSARGDLRVREVEARGQGIGVAAPIPWGDRVRRFREGIRRSKKGKRAGSNFGPKPFLGYSPSTDLRLRSQEPATGDVFHE